jgi:hypothetical protein
MYKPHTNSDRRRYVEEVDMEAPIHFWVDNPSECGIPLSDALHSRVRRLLKRDETVFEGRGPSVSIRLEVHILLVLHMNLDLLFFFSGPDTGSGVDRFRQKTFAAHLAPLRAPSWPKMLQSVSSGSSRCVFSPLSNTSTTTYSPSSVGET